MRRNPVPRRSRAPLAVVLAACAPLALAGLLGAAAAPPPAAGAAATPAARLDRPPGPRAVLKDGRELVLEVPVRPGATWTSIGQEYLTDLRALATLRAAGGAAGPAAGGFVAIPYAALNDIWKTRTIQDLFPLDGPRGGDWIHRVGAGRLRAFEESLWDLAAWLTGRGENFEALAARNAIADLVPRAGQEVVVPGRLLIEPFASLAAGRTPAEGEAPAVAAADAPEAADDFTPAEPEPEPEGEPRAPSPPTPPQAEGAGDLRYGKDARGTYALYRLKRGEALYSAVVVRFTGRIDVQEVNELARVVAARSGVRDVTEMRIGHPVKIPLDLLLPEYLPPGDTRRAEWEKSRAEVERYTNPSFARGLRGVTVILDAGHGGRDRGAAHHGVWEHDYVYDVLCRIKEALESRTAASVLPIIKDRREGYTVRDSTRLVRSQAEVVLTDPPFALEDALVGVNLRWYLANAHFRRLTSAGHDPLKIVFTSLHADARHPSLGGAMVYVPGEEYRRRRYGYSGAVYTRYREVREKPYVAFTRAERERSEGLSRQFAGRLIAAFRRHGVAVHPHEPIRERIIRRGRSWVPAVLRCNVVPVEILVELSNLSNARDSRFLADPAYRQAIADAYVDALRRYYGEPTPAPPPKTASSSPDRGADTPGRGAD